MERGPNGSKIKKKSKMLSRLLLPMLLLILFQLVTFFSVLTIGGEFTFIRKYAYDTLVEKTENRKSYVEKELQQKVPFVEETAAEINAMIAQKLAADNKDISCIQTDKEYNRELIALSVETIIYLLRRSLVNDVFLILETGNLYTEDGKSETKPGIYLRDLDPTTDSGYDDLLMEMGYSSIAKDFDIVLDSGWTARFEPDSPEDENYDFYYQTLQTAQKHNMLSVKELGYWSDFSSLTQNSAGSIKYTVPLIAEDGTVYGVLGIGLTEKSVLANLSANDFISESACYVLCRKKNPDEAFEICMHSGIAFNRLIGTETELRVQKQLDTNVYDFDLPSHISSVGSIQYMNLYNSNSVYSPEDWAIISVAERSDVLRVFTNLIGMLLLAALISVAVSIAVIFVSSKMVVKPISTVIDTMNAKQEFTKVIQFRPTNIYELDKLTDAIMQLQKNAQDFSSQVSKMLRVADIGLCTFMYDPMDDSVFVGQSMLKLLHLSEEQEGDMVISRELFLENIIAPETKAVITECLLKRLEIAETTGFSREYSVAHGHHAVTWMRLSVVGSQNKTIGVLQDITGAVLEKQRIEYERDYDSTTGLLNRHAYYRKINALFSNPKQLKITAFLMIDLDNLKYVNDTYGHDFGDDYIKTAATVLKSFETYRGIVSRLSGDEFNVCLWGFSSKDEIRKIVDSVRTQMRNSYCLLADGTRFKMRASAGVAWYPDDAVSYEQLMKYADFAMYTIKHTTKGETAEFNMEAYAKDSVLITGVEEMNRIIDECSIRYAFHSIVSAHTGEIYGYEALMRPQSTILHSPIELLRIAKTGAKLNEIERLTWTESLRAFRKQLELGNIPQGSHIFINTISNSVLEAPDVRIVEEENADILPYIVMEVLESEDVNEAYNARKVKRLEKWKAKLALDDFGTGYNSDYALITLHPDIIKIDRSIISGCDRDVSRQTLISNFVRVAKTKEIMVLAEGVETENELRTVIACGVDLLQGYFINRPVFEPQPIPQEVVDKIRGFHESAK